jgi:hypothetical protein
MITIQEIDLARQLKESGLERKWRTGDMVFDTDDEGLYIVVDDGIGELIRLRDGERGIDKVIIKIDGRLCWLPQFHQCQEILEQQGYYFLLFCKSDNVQLDLWKPDKNYVGVFRGKTVLDVMYQAINAVVPPLSP